jgi:hypothetical protein
VEFLKSHRRHNDQEKMNGLIIRKRQRPNAFLQILLLLSFFSFVFYCTTLSPIANRYRNLGGEEEKKLDKDIPSSHISISSPTISPVAATPALKEVLKRDSVVTPSPTFPPTKTTSVLVNPLHNVESESNEKEAIECQLEMEKYLYPKIYQWVTEKVPIAVNVKVIKNQYHVIFNTGYIDPDIWYNAKYHCNGSNDTATVLSSTKPGKGNLIIQCPEAIQYNKEMLRTVSVFPRKGWNVTLYETELFVRCEQLDMKHFSPPDTSIGMCTSLSGKGKVRDIALQWVEYHKLIGVDHTWIYINSDWDDGKQPERPYISWIPYNLNIKAYDFANRPWTQRSEFFRVTSQVECVLRARRMGVDWIIFTDIDEYVQIVDNATISEECQPVLKQLLDTYYKDERNDIGGLVMNSIPFGNNLEIEENPNKSLLIDHVYRNKINPKEARWTTWKQIVNPQNVHNYAKQMLGGGDVLKEIRLDANRVRINHYKEVNKGVGVFQTENSDDLVEDRALADNYHTRLVNAMDTEEK